MLRALDLARRIEAGECTPADVVERCAEAIAAREEQVGAFAAFDIDAARRHAQRDGTALAAKPLRGLAVGAKDIFDTADFPTEYGSPIYAGHRPQADAALVAQVRDAGGILLGKTVTTEFAFFYPGRTRNPHNLDHTPGGSSSGSAAAIAAGMLPIALASQTGGSTIRPAAFCGVAGYKPSFDLLPTTGMKGMVPHLDTVGLMAAGVADVAFAAAAISSFDLRVDRGTPASPRIALMRTHLWSQASAAMQAATETALRAAEAAGARVLELDIPEVCAQAYEMHGPLQSYEGYRAMTFELTQHRDKLSPVLLASLDAGATTTAEAYHEAMRVGARARAALAAAMADIDVLLTPSAPGAALKGLSSIGTSPFNRLWTLMRTPCVNVPGLADGIGLPLGVQIIGPFGRDRETLHAAYFVECAIARHSA